MFYRKRFEKLEERVEMAEFHLDNARFENRRLRADLRDLKQTVDLLMDRFAFKVVTVPAKEVSKTLVSKNEGGRNA